MSHSFFVTNSEKRIEIALQLLDRGRQTSPECITGDAKLNGKADRLDIKYNPETDIFSADYDRIRGDLLHLYTCINNLNSVDGKERFCEEFDLDLELLNRKKAVLRFIGFKVCHANESLIPALKPLKMMTDEDAETIAANWGIESSVLRRFNAVTFRGKNGIRAAFPLKDSTGTVLGIRAINPELEKPVLQQSSDRAPTTLFPDISLLEPDSPLMVTLGEIDALFANSLGINATGIVNWRDENIVQLVKSSFKDRDVVIAFPADRASQEGALLIAESINTISNGVSIINWPPVMGMPEINGLGLRDFVTKFGGTFDDMNKLKMAYEVNEPLPLRRTPSGSEKYPVDVLPPVLSNAINDISSALQCSEALPAQAILAVCSLAVQGHTDVEIDGRIYPTSNFFLTVAESGERKSAVDKIVMAPVREREEELRAEIRQQRADYAMKMKIRKKQESLAMNSDDPEMSMRALGPAPLPPLDDMLTCEEPTFEGLQLKLLAGQPSIGLFSDEGGRMLGGHAMSRENQQKTGAGLSNLSDGKPVTRTRAGDGSSVLVGRRLTTHLMVQPVISNQFLGNELLMGQGLLSRFLVAHPESTIGKRPYSNVNLKMSVALKRFHAAISYLLKEALPIREGTANELDPPSLGLSKEAKAAWIDFHNQVEDGMADGGKYATIRGFAAKSAEHVARLACVITVVDNPEAEYIPRRWVESAIQVLNYHLSEALRLFSTGYESPDAKLAEKCLEWLKASMPIFSPVELYQYGPNQVRTRDDAKRIIKILEDHGHVREIPGGAVIKSGTKYNKRIKAWQVVE